MFSTGNRFSLDRRLFLWTMCAALFTALAGTAHADATLDKIKQRGKLSVGVDGVGPPFGVMDPATGQVAGFQVDLARDLAKRLGVELEIVSVVASTRVQFLQAGKVDLLIANIQWTKERNQILSFAPTPYNLVGAGAIVANNSGIHKWEDLRGKVACVSQGSNFTKPLQETYGAIVKGFKGIPESLLALKGGSCAASVHIYPAMRYTLIGESAAQWKDYTLATTDQLIPSPTVIWLRRGEVDTQAFVNQAIKDWHRSGTLLALADKHGVPDEYIRSANQRAQQGQYDHVPFVSDLK